MNYSLKLFSLLCIFVINVKADGENTILNNLLSEIQTALNVEALTEGSQTREQQYPLKGNNGISLGVYQALQSIARNDELECISRLLCEAAAGGQPGFSGKQKFDKLSLTKLISYLKLDIGSKSPLLVFGKAALLGVTNRGDPYSCIINYPKCPRDQSRLLYYLNNHRGGFFQYFDKGYTRPENYYHQHQYRPVYNYQNYQKQFKRNKIQFESAGGLYEKLKKKATTNVYATKYAHSTLSFPGESYKRSKPMVFPKSDDLIDPRILTKPGVRTPAEENNFYFSRPSRFPKKLNYLNFFPQKNNPKGPAVATDRLPGRFYFPENEESYVNNLTRLDQFFTSREVTGIEIFKIVRFWTSNYMNVRKYKFASVLTSFMKYIKSKYRNSLKDSTSEDIIRLATTNIDVDIKGIDPKQLRPQCSH